MQSSERFAVSIAARTPAEAGSVRTPKRIFRLSGWAVRKSAAVDCAFVSSLLKSIQVT